MNIHEKYINRCIEIGKNGLGSTAPNPMVGCVIVLNDEIIGEGFTSEYGSHHAEVNAINIVKDKSLLKKATLYVTLEPCSHYGKTPPCSDLIIKHKIPNVVIGTLDIHSKVSGKGIEALKKANCNVIVGVLEKECLNHHKRFFTFHKKKRPYIILKWAQTSDRFIAPVSKKTKEPVWISNEFSKQLVHKWRAEEQAILVGANTITEDNPSLTTRIFKGKNPIRIVVDLKNNLNKNYAVFDAAAETIVLTSNEIKDSKQIANQICENLYNRNITSVIIEGGAKTLQLFISENLWDEARVFTSSALFHEGLKAPTLSNNIYKEMHIKTDILKIYTND